MHVALSHLLIHALSPPRQPLASCRAALCAPLELSLLVVARLSRRRERGFQRFTALRNRSPRCARHPVRCSIIVLQKLLARSTRTCLALWPCRRLPRSPEGMGDRYEFAGDLLEEVKSIGQDIIVKILDGKVYQHAKVSRRWRFLAFH
jgi:hypothetical protein